MNRRERGVEQCNKSARMPSNSLIPKVYFLSFRLFSRGLYKFFFLSFHFIFYFVEFSIARGGQGSRHTFFFTTLFDTRKVNSFFLRTFLCRRPSVRPSGSSKTVDFFTAQITNRKKRLVVFGSSAGSPDRWYRLSVTSLWTLLIIRPIAKALYICSRGRCVRAPASVKRIFESERISRFSFSILFSFLFLYFPKRKCVESYSRHDRAPSE